MGNLASSNLVLVNANNFLVLFGFLVYAILLLVIEVD